MSLMVLQFIARSNTTSTVIVVGIFAFLVLLIVLSGRSNRTGGSSKGGGYKKARFTKMAKLHNLEPHHIRMLQKAIVDQKIATPDRLFQKGSLLNRTLQKLIEGLGHSEMSQGKRNQIIAEVFEIKNRIINASHSQMQLAKTGRTQSLKLGQEVTIFSQVLPPANSHITAVMDSFLAIETPVSASGSPMKYRPGSVLKIRLVTRGNSIYAFTTKVRKFTMIDGFENMLVDHSTKVTHNQLRKHQRKEIDITATFQKVEIVTDSSQKQVVKRALVNKNQRSIGQIQDISKGGCALYSRNPLSRGRLVKIRFNLGGEDDISVFGKVNGIESKPPIGALMHISFTRASTQHLNEIQSYVHGFFEG